MYGKCFLDWRGESIW